MQCIFRPACVWKEIKALHPDSYRDLTHATLLTRSAWPAHASPDEDLYSKEDCSSKRGWKVGV